MVSIMQPKKNLTQAQRVMLDKLYTKQFQLKRDEIRVARDRKLEEIKQEAGKQFAKRPDIAKALKLAEQYNKVIESIDVKKLNAEGAFFSMCKINTTNVVGAYSRSQYGYDTHAELPIITAFKQETEDVLANVGKAENEMRLRIAGSDVTYAEIEAEINEILKGVTL